MQTNLWFEQVFHYQFKNPNLLTKALEHKSNNSLENNEILEFFGDSLIGFLVSQKLIEQYPDADEGTLTKMRSKIVGNQNLGKLAQKISLAKQIQIGPSLSKDKKYKQKNQIKILANCLEAIFAAIYLDNQSLIQTKQIFCLLFKDNFVELEKKQLKDAKTLLQEYCQSYNLPLPQYGLIKVEKGEFSLYCKVHISVNKIIQTQGTHRQKKIAQQKAAREVLNQLKID